jgi:MOSC domain-containing protein YiiM
MATVLSINISEKKGTPKTTIAEGRLIEDFGFEGDAHAGKWHRQVSLLGMEQIEEFRARGAEVAFGAFGENLVVEGWRMRLLPVGTRLRIGDVLLEITQIGKECHSHCNIFETMGDCIMPREGVFARVLRGGIVRTGDAIELCDE